MECELSPECHKAVGESLEARAGLGGGAAAAVVAYLQAHDVVALLDAHGGALGIGVLGDVGERFGDRELNRRLDRRRGTLSDGDVHVDGQ
jgi:hypothetical protein